jgi:GNAT superfamily N-acetyltransferase
VFSIREATVSDCKTIGDLLVRSARFAYADIGSPEYLAALDPNERASEYEQLLPSQRDGHYTVFLACDGDLPLGFAELELNEAEAPRIVGVLQRMFFVPESLGRGLSTVLHDRVVEEFTQWGCSEAALTYIRGNDRARSFYLKNGWIETGEVHPFDDHGRTLYDVVMRRPFPSII